MALIKIHHKLSHNHRIQILSGIVDELLSDFFADKRIQCLDVGCGDMQLAEEIQNKKRNTIWRCVDLYPLPDHFAHQKRWKKYSRFNGEHLPFADKCFDVVLLADVLHHADSVSTLLSEAARISNHIIIKDHFEYGFFFRQILKLMDIIGNWSYGVRIPETYFTPKSFRHLIQSAGLHQLQIIDGISLYRHLPLIQRISPPKLQFVSFLQA